MSAILALALLAGQVAQAAVPVSYNITAIFDAGNALLTSHVELTVDQSLRDSLILRLAGNELGRVRLTNAVKVTTGQAATSTTSDSSHVVVTVRQTGRVTVSFDYVLALDTLRRKRDGYYLLPSPTPAQAWYPVVSGLPDSVERFSDFEVTLELPANLKLLTSGTPVDSITSGGMERRRYRGEHLESFALAIADSDYLVRTAVVSGITASALSPRADTLIWDRVARETVKAAAWYRETYGFFPTSTIGIVPGSRGARGGFPLSRIFMIHQGDLSPGFVRWITAHELAHYYWGLHVLSSAERLDWLMLGMGIWTDQWYLAQTAKTPLEVQWRDPQGDNSFERLAEAQLRGVDQRLGLAESEADSLPYDYNSLIRHAKAAVGVYLLSLKLGPDRFVALQRSLLEQFRYHPLSPEAFVARLEAAGVKDAGEFLREWMRGDARLEYAVSGVRPDSSSPISYWIDVDRTGTVEYPVTIEVRSSAGKSVRAELAGGESDSVLVNLPGPIKDILIDPDGKLPTWSSANRGIWAAYLRALGSSGPLEPFLTLAQAHLKQGRDSRVGALMVERLFVEARYGEIGRVVANYPWLTQCSDRATCLAGLQVARSWYRSGLPVKARGLLKELSAKMIELGLGGHGRLGATRAELGVELH